MNTSKNECMVVTTKELKVGDCLGYKDLCTFLNVPVYCGNQKKAQLKDFSRYFEYEKVGKKYLITDIYDTPLPKEHKYPANAIYVKYIEVILLQYLIKQPNYEVQIPSQSLWEQLGMINHNFIVMQDNKDELLNLHEDMNRFQINDFYKRCREKFYKILEGSLKSLQRQRLINYKKIYMVKYPGVFECQVATPKEEEYILKADRETLVEMGFEDMNHMYLSGKSVAFYSIRNHKLYEMAGIENAYEYWDIIHNHENTINALPHSQVQLEKLMLNNEIVKTINAQAETRYDKYGEENEEIFDALLDGETPFFYKKGYIDMQLLLSDKLLKIRSDTESN